MKRRTGTAATSIQPATAVEARSFAVKRRYEDVRSQSTDEWQSAATS